MSKKCWIWNRCVKFYSGGILSYLTWESSREAPTFKTMELFIGLNIHYVVLIDKRRDRKNILFLHIEYFQNYRPTSFFSIVPFLYFFPIMLIFEPLWKSICITTWASLWTSFLVFQVSQPWEGILWPYSWVLSSSIMYCIVYYGERMSIGKFHFVI